MLHLVSLFCLALQAGSLQAVPIEIIGSGGPPVAGQSYSLICNVPESANITSYLWTKGDKIFTNEIRGILALPPLHLSDAGTYTCEVNSSHRAQYDLRLAIPPPTSIELTSNKSNPIRPIGSSVSLLCNLELSPLIDINGLNLTIVWTGPKGNITQKNIQLMGNSSTHEATVDILFMENDSGDYNCSATVVVPKDLLQYLYNSEVVISNKTRIVTGVYVSFNENVLDNNSNITNTKQDDSLVCHTDNPNCCIDISEGRWYSYGTNKNNNLDLTAQYIEGALSLSFDNIDQNTIGILCCTIPDFSNHDQTICINFIPSIIVYGAQVANIGEDYILTCNVSGGGSFTFQWRQNNIPLNTTGPTLSFSPLRLHHAGLYSCNITAGYSDNNEIILHIPAPDSVELTSNKTNPIRPEGSSVTLTCIVALNPVVVYSDLNVLTVKAQLFANQGMLQNLTDPIVNGTTFIFTTQLSSFGRTDSGNYTCSAIVIPHPPTDYLTINDSVVSPSIKVSTGIFLSINGYQIPNKSNISIDMIGQEPNDTLSCLTDFYQFYIDSDVFGDVARWYLPNGSDVTIDNNSDVYMSSDQGVARLHRKNNALMPTGKFRCEVFDSNRTRQSICIEVYYESMSNISSPAITEGAGVNGTVLGGAAVGGMLLMLIFAAGIVLAIFAIRRLRERSKQLKYSCHTRGFSEAIEAIDSTKLPPETEEDKGECIELNECDEIQVDKVNESNFADTSLTDGKCTKPIPVSEFCNHVEQLHADRDKLFETEYTRISRLPKFCTSEAKLPYNTPKNRFANILPYDYSRVKLTEIEGEEGSDYINANHLDGYNKPNAYIAAQGPLPNTVGDFWRMIWENELSTIVMLTRCFEGRVKCEEYWPVNVGESISPSSDLTITLTAVLPFTDYSIRKMTITHSGIPESTPQEVIQFHFLGWPDHGVPQNGVVLINFIRRVRTIHPYSDPCPLLVHCSAGVGRTGAFIVLDSMLERVKKEDNLNIFEFLKQLRAQRVLVVQTQPQYNFIHDVLNELILTGDTEITAQNLRIVMNRLYKIKDGETGYSKQFKILDQVSPKPRESDYTQANMEYNAGKNRYPHIRPNDHHRVLLRELLGSGLDYINASFINGYRQHGTYIATQVPMENTVNDFWKMIWEYKSKIIVVLCKMAEDGEIYHDFLPASKGSSMRYGKIEVKFVFQQVSTDYMVKQVELSEDRGTDKHDVMTVTLFHYLRWPKNGSPQRTASLLEVIELVNKKQMSSGNKAITVMCNDGVGRTGTFICVHAQLERLKTEGVVDFFQSIKSARIQRAGLVPDVDQYVLCHTVVADFLNDFDAYANFKDLI